MVNLWYDFIASLLIGPSNKFHATVNSVTLQELQSVFVIKWKRWYCNLYEYDISGNFCMVGLEMNESRADRTRLRKSVQKNDGNNGKKVKILI